MVLPRPQVPDVGPSDIFWNMWLIGSVFSLLTLTDLAIWGSEMLEKATSPLSPTAEEAAVCLFLALLCLLPSPSFPHSLLFSVLPSLLNPSL